MLVFSERLKLTKVYRAWCDEASKIGINIQVNNASFTAFLEVKGLLNEEAVRKLLKENKNDC